ncbi:MAG: class I SAM-dependent methyltransferase [Acidobacteriota bacterium]
MGFYDQHVLPHVLDLAMRADRLTPYRQRTIAQAEGRVLEIGVGSGVNLAFYSSRATELLALDPHVKLLAMMRKQPTTVPVQALLGSAESIPVDTASVDTVVTTWTLCSIPHVVPALKEMRRVLKHSGRLLFVEHGLSRDPDVCRWQQRLTPLWRHIAGGCHLDRPIAQLITAAGFRMETLDTNYAPGPRPFTFLYEGAARPD